MNVRTTGSNLPSRTVMVPYFSKKRVIRSRSWWLIRTQRPYRSTSGRPPAAPIQYASTDPRLHPIAPAVAAQKRLNRPVYTR